LIDSLRQLKQLRKSRERRRADPFASQDEPPLRFAAGADAIATVEQKAKDLLAQADAYREMSSNLAHDEA
jgi:hypothetical protein